MIEYRKLRIGEAFTFDDIKGRVFVKCRDGYRDGRGGQLHSCQPLVWVRPYQARPGFSI